MPSTNFDIHHTRIAMETNIIEVRQDDLNQLSLIVNFEHEYPDGYYLDEDLIPFAVYLDRKFYAEFYGRTTKVQLQSFDAVQILEVFALPHFGYFIEREKEIPGNKIRIRWRGRNPEVYDVKQYYLFYDNATGNIETDEIGVVDALTGEGQGRLIQEARIVS